MIKTLNALRTLFKNSSCTPDEKRNGTALADKLETLFTTAVHVASNQWKYEKLWAEQRIKALGLNKSYLVVSINPDNELSIHECNTLEDAEFIHDFRLHSTIICGNIIPTDKLKED